MASQEQPPEARAPWYADGLAFECRPDCGACCTNHGDYSYVYLEPDESRRIAEHPELEHRVFLRRFTDRDDGWRILRMDLPDCPFLAGKRCTIYPVRPAQCRTFPFWRENLADPERWAALRSFCPGVDEGPVHGLEMIGEHLRSRTVND